MHDKGVVVDQGVVTPDGDGWFTVTYDARALNAEFPFVSLTAHEGCWEGLADEVAITLLAVGAEPRATTITLMGEEVFIGSANAPGVLSSMVAVWMNRCKKQRIESQSKGTVRITRPIQAGPE